MKRTLTEKLMIYDFLQIHTWKQTAAQFNVSEMQILRIKKEIESQDHLNITIKPKEEIHFTPEMIDTANTWLAWAKKNKRKKLEELLSLMKVFF